MKKRKMSGRYLPLLLVAPALLYYAAFWMAPTLTAIRETFTNEAGAFSLENFAVVFSDPAFKEAMLNTAVFVIVSVVIQFVLAIAVSLVLNKRFPGARAVLFVTLIPMALPPTAMAIMWKSGLAEFGWVNSILLQLHIIEEPIVFLAYSGIEAVLFLVLIDTWTVLPSIVIIILAGLQNLSKEYEEAGLVFGANRFQTIKDIVVPILRPSIVTAMLLRLIAAVQLWLLAVMIFGYNNVPFLVERIAYKVEMTPNAPGAMKYAYTMSTLVAVIVGVIAVAYIRYNNKQAQKGGGAK